VPWVFGGPPEVARQGRSAVCDEKIYHSGISMTNFQTERRAPKRQGALRLFFANIARPRLWHRKRSANRAWAGLGVRRDAWEQAHA